MTNFLCDKCGYPIVVYESGLSPNYQGHEYCDQHFLELDSEIRDKTIWVVTSPRIRPYVKLVSSDVVVKMVKNEHKSKILYYLEGQG